MDGGSAVTGSEMLVSTTLPDLPTEILECILSFADNKDLMVVVTCNSVLRDLGSRRLYRSLSDQGFSMERTRLMFGVLQSQPMLASHVRCCQLYLTKYSLPDTAQSDWNMVASALKNLRNLRTLKLWVVMCPRWILNDVYFPRLSSLDAYTPPRPEWSPITSSFLARHNHLTTLHIKGELETPFISLPPSALPRLHVLSVTNPNHVRLLAGPGRTSLKKVNIYPFSTSVSKAPIDGVAPALEALSKVDGNTIQEVVLRLESPCDFVSIGRSMTGLLSLRSLALHCDFKALQPVSIRKIWSEC